MPITWSLKEDASKYQLVTVGVTFKANSTLKTSKVGHCASWSSWLNCLQLWHKANPCGVNDRQLLLAKEVKETKHWSIQERYQFSHMLLLGPFRTTCSYFDISVSIGPTSVSHYKWMLSGTPFVCTKH